jgi:hypothetical protein
MRKSALAALAVSAAALFSSVMATPSFAATTTKPLVIGSQVTITVSCPKDHHAVDRSGKLSCVLDKKKHHKAKPAPKPAPAPQRHRCWSHHDWADNYWTTEANNTWL